ncbi:hypothetical protein Tco_1431849 [Tanacetum coccineum]
MVGAGHAAYTDRFHELAKLVPHLVTPESKRIDRYIYGLVSEIRRMVRVTEPSTIPSVILKVRGLTDDVVRNELLKKNSEKRKDNGETSKQGDVRTSNKRARTVPNIKNLHPVVCVSTTTDLVILKKIVEKYERIRLMLFSQGYVTNVGARIISVTYVLS